MFRVRVHESLNHYQYMDIWKRTLRLMAGAKLIDLIFEIAPEHGKIIIHVEVVWRQGTKTETSDD